MKNNIKKEYLNILKKKKIMPQLNKCSKIQKEEKLKLEIEKMQQKLQNANNNSLYNSSIISNSNKPRNNSRFSRNDKKRNSHSIDVKNNNNNLFSGLRRKNKSRENTLRLSITNNPNDNNINLEAIDLGFGQCEYEIDNLNILEEMLEKQKNKINNLMSKKKPILNSIKKYNFKLLLKKNIKKFIIKMGLKCNLIKNYLYKKNKYY